MRTKRPIKRGAPTPDPMKDVIIEEYMKHGNSQHIIASILNIGVRRVRKVLHEAGIDTYAMGNILRGQSISATRRAEQ